MFVLVSVVLKLFFVRLNCKCVCLFVWDISLVDKFVENMMVLLFLIFFNGLINLVYVLFVCGFSRVILIWVVCGFLVVLWWCWLDNWVGIMCVLFKISWFFDCRILIRLLICLFWMLFWCVSKSLVDVCGMVGCVVIKFLGRLKLNLFSFIVEFWLMLISLVVVDGIFCGIYLVLVLIVGWFLCVLYWMFCLRCSWNWLIFCFYVLGLCWYCLVGKMVIIFFGNLLFWWWVCMFYLRKC